MKEVLPVDTGMDITTERRPNSGSNDEAENLQFRERTKDAKNINGAYLSILLAAGVPFIIVVSICGVLLGLTFSNRVILEPGWPELQLPVSSDNSSTSLLTQAESFKENGGSGAYYIQFNPSSLTTIASWTGKVIPYLSSATMALAAFFAANHIREKSRTGRDEELLTPHQLSLLLGLLSGGAEQLWETVRYRCRRGKHLPKPIPLVFTALSVTILLGVLIPAVDTWFGIVTTPVQVAQLQTITTPTNSFGRGLVSYCTNSSDQTANSITSTIDHEYLSGDYIPCILAVGPDGSELQSESEAYATMNNVSQTNTVKEYSPDSLKVFYYLSDSATSADVDFKATTFAVTTECEVITSKCNLNLDTSTFNCTPSFAGSLTSPGPAVVATRVTDDSPVGVQYFGDPGLMNNFSTTSGAYSPQNPLYFGTWATAQPVGSITSADDGDIVTIAGTGLGYSWVLNCTSTIYEATYTWVNGTVTSFNTSLANGTVGGIFSGAFAGGFGGTALQNMALLAGVNNGSDGLADTTAAYFSRNSLALSVGAMESRLNTLEQSRSSLSLTRVPLVPFYMLIALKLIYALSTVLFAFAVMIWAHPSESQDVKTRLSIKGLVVASFESDKLKEKAVGAVEEMFSENSQDGQAEKKKVAIVKTEQGGWAYVTTAVEVGHSVLGVISATAKGT